jgi:hypothetical protein
VIQVSGSGHGQVNAVRSANAGEWPAFTPLL